jgi:hypothetical protein
MRKDREITNKIYDAVNSGVLTWQQVAEGALQYMSEDDVADMAHNEEFFLYEDDIEEDEEDDVDLDIDELTEIAMDTVADHINIIRETATNQSDLADAIYNLARDSVVGNGGTDSRAAIIAGYVRTQF